MIKDEISPAPEHNYYRKFDKWGDLKDSHKVSLSHLNPADSLGLLMFLEIKQLIKELDEAKGLVAGVKPPSSWQKLKKMLADKLYTIITGGQP